MKSSLLRFTIAAALPALHTSASLASDLTARISYRTLEAPNACLPDAIGFQNAYQVQQKMRQSVPWSRVLMVHSRGKTSAHAFCVFLLDGKLWAYDQTAGSRRVWVAPEKKTDAATVGRLLLPEQFDRAVWLNQTF